MREIYCLLPTCYRNKICIKKQNSSNITNDVADDLLITFNHLKIDEITSYVNNIIIKQEQIDVKEKYLTGFNLKNKTLIIYLPVLTPYIN